MANTGLIKKVAFGAADATEPTLPAPGSDINWSALSGTWPTTLGAIEDGDDGDLDVDNISVTPLDESTLIDPPLAQNADSEIVHKKGIESVSFSTYSVNQAVSALSSTVATSDNEEEEGTTVTYRAMCVETAGLFVDYYPKVRVKVAGEQGAIKENLQKFNFECRVFGTSTVPSGRKRLYFNG